MPGEGSGLWTGAACKAERLHDPGHQPLPDHDPGLRAGLQRVELVLQGCQPNGAYRGHHKQTATAGRRRPAKPRRRADYAVSPATARQGGLDQIANRQHPFGFAARQGCCGAVQDNGPMGGAAALRQRQDRTDYRAVQAPKRAVGDWATAQFRFNRTAMIQVKQFALQGIRSLNLRLNRGPPDAAPSS